MKRNRFAMLCLVIVLCVALCAPALAAKQVLGADVRLQMLEGTVELTNANGRTLSVRDGMKLHGGYVVDTAAQSYAYIKLDDDKVVKQDENSRVTILKSRKLLELVVEEGTLFFNIESPVTGTPALNISTSTMVTGIRGTSGYVIQEAADEDDDRRRAIVVILDGSVEIEYHTGGGAKKQVVSAGEVCTLTEGIPVAGGAAESSLAMSSLQSSDIPSFVMVEIAVNPGLRERILEDGGLAPAEMETICEQSEPIVSSRPTPRPNAEAEADAATGSHPAGAQQISRPRPTPKPERTSKPASTPMPPPPSPSPAPSP